jgi:hypothetical protein
VKNIAKKEYEEEAQEIYDPIKEENDQIVKESKNLKNIIIIF